MYPFGMNEVKIVPTTGTPTPVDLPASRQLGVTLTFINNTLRGNDKIVSVASQVEAAEWSLEAGGISLAALAVLVGGTATSSGTTPNRVTTLKINGGMNMPYVKIYGKILGDGIDDMHVKLYKAKVTGLEGSYQNGEFFVTSCSGIAVHDGTNGVMDFVENETATALPTS